MQDRTVQTKVTRHFCCSLFVLLALPSVAIAQDGTLLVPSDTAVGDQFGHSVAISGSTAVVAANGDDGDTGSAYIFERQAAGSWVQVKKLQAPIPEVGSEFGSSVAIFGDDVVVGADLADEVGVDSGAAFVFSRNQGGPDEWGLVRELMGSGVGAGDRLGTWMDMTDGRVAITSFAGTFVFERDRGGTDNWGEVPATITGGSIALDGDTMALGLAVDDDNCPPQNPDCNTGAVVIVRKDAGGTDNWGQVARITAPGSPEGAYFGFSVALSGDTLAVGAIFAPGAGTRTGSVYVFERNLGGAENWGFSKEIEGSTIDENDWYGVSVGILNDYLVGGSRWGDCPGVVDSGAAYLFLRDNGGADQWGESRLFCSTSPEDNDIFGNSVAIAPGFTIVGAQHDDIACPGNPNCNSGSAFVFERPVPLYVNVSAGGLVSSNPPGISCPTDCAGGFEYGTNVELLANPDPDYHLVAWSGDCSGSGSCVVSMSAEHNVGALFDSMPFLDGFESGDTSRWSATTSSQLE